jgi:hypothetical protein
MLIQQSSTSCFATGLLSSSNVLMLCLKTLQKGQRIQHFPNLFNHGTLFSLNILQTSIPWNPLRETLIQGNRVWRQMDSLFSSNTEELPESAGTSLRLSLILTLTLFTKCPMTDLCLIYSSLQS